MSLLRIYIYILKKKELLKKKRVADTMVALYLTAFLKQMTFKNIV